MTIACFGVRAGYRGFSLNDISVDLPSGKLTALIGPNGCGKSTLFAAMAGLLPLSAGRVEIDGMDIAGQPPRTVARRLALLPQSPIVPPAIQVEQLVAYGRAPYQNFLGLRRAADDAAIGSAMERAGVAALRDRRLSDLSGGQRQRAFVAMCLAQDTPVMLFDEPTSFLDIRYQFETLELLADLARSGRTIVVVLHDVGQAARFADHLVLMRDGAVQSQGIPRAVITPSRMFDVYGIQTQVYADPVTGSPQISPLSANPATPGVEVPTRT